MVEYAFLFMWNPKLWKDALEFYWDYKSDNGHSVSCIWLGPIGMQVSTWKVNESD